MCENCKEHENEINKQEIENQDEYRDITEEELQALLSQESKEQEDMLPLFQMEFEDFDQDEFQRGIKEASYIAGFYTCCKNAGMYGADVVNLLLNRETIIHNKELSEINNKANLENIKAQNFVLEKQQL